MRRPGVREPALREWAAAMRAGDAAGAGDVAWFELAAAGSSSLAVLALIAAAADPATTAETAEQVRRGVLPLDRGAQHAARQRRRPRARRCGRGELNFVSQYPHAGGGRRTAAGGDDARDRRRARLPHGERHVVLVAGMIAMHVSEAGAWLPSAQPATRAVLRAADTLAMPLLLVLLRAWRRVG